MYLIKILGIFDPPSPLLTNSVLLWPPLPPISDYVIHGCSLVNSSTKFLHTLKRLLGGSNAYYEIGIHEYLIHDFKSGLSCHKRTLSQGPLEKLTEHSKLHMTTWENERRADNFQLDNLSRTRNQALRAWFENSRYWGWIEAESHNWSHFLVNLW